MIFTLLRLHSQKASFFHFTLAGKFIPAGLPSILTSKGFMVFGSLYYYYYIFIFIQGHPYRPIGLLTGCPNQVLNWMRRAWSDVALRISGGAEFHLTAAKYDSECKPKRRETLGRTRPLDTCERVRRAVRWVVETERRQNRSLRRGLVCPEIQRNTRV